MSVPFGPGIDELHKRAADELRRIVLELCAASNLANDQIAENMGYKSRNIVSIMRNYQYGQVLYPEWALFAFLLAVGVRDIEDVVYVFRVYDFVSGRTTTRLATKAVRVDKRAWWEKPAEPCTDEVTVPRAKRRELARILVT